MPNIFDIVATGQCGPPEGGGPAGQTVAEKVPPPQDTCRLLTGGLTDEGFPPPGSAEFCNALEHARDNLEAIATIFLAWIPSINPITFIADRLKFKTRTQRFTSPLDIIPDLWNQLVDNLAATARVSTDIITLVVNEIRGIQSCIVPKKNRRAYEGVWILRQLLHLIENIRVGIDPGIWATVDIHPNFDLVREWLTIVERYFAPIELPSAEAATEAWKLNRITQEQRDCVWLLNGFDPASYAPFAEVAREQLDWREAIQYVRRTRGNALDEEMILRQRGFTSQDDATMAREMYWELPTIADHLHWLQRNVFDTDYVRDYKLEEGFDDKFWPTFGHDLTALGLRERYARYHYAAHWIQPSPEQMREMVYRSQEIAALTGKGFDENDYERILTEQDYSPLARKWFRAIIYQVPAISYIKEWYRQDIINKDQLTEYHHRLGFSPKDAERFADIDDLQKRRMRASASKGWTTTAATNAWFTGLITLERHDEIYRDLGYDSREAEAARDVANVTFNVSAVKRAKTRALSGIISLVTQAVDVGVMSQQAAADNLRVSGWPREQAEGFAGLISQGGAVKKVRQAITYVRRHVIDGSIPFPVAQQELQRLGITAEATANYLSLWRLQMTPGRKRRTAAQIVADVASRHITTADAINRLVNLGYNDADTRLYMADAQAKLLKTQQGLLAAQQKKGLQAIKAQEAMAKEMQRQRRQLQSDMLKATPVKTLQAWAKKGIVSHKRFVSRMMQMGWTRPDAELYYVEACKGKGAECTETEPHAAGEGGSGGGGGPDGGGSADGTGAVPPPGEIVR